MLYQWINTDLEKIYDAIQGNTIDVSTLATENTLREVKGLLITTDNVSVADEVHSINVKLGKPFGQLATTLLERTETSPAAAIDNVREQLNILRSNYNNVYAFGTIQCMALSGGNYYAWLLIV